MGKLGLAFQMDDQGKFLIMLYAVLLPQIPNYLQLLYNSVYQ